MKTELVDLLSLPEPMDIELDQLVKLLTDEECPRLNNTFAEERLTPLELLCRNNKSLKLKESIQILIKKEPFLLNGTKALDYVCKYYCNDDLFDIIYLLVKHCHIDFLRPGLRLRRIFEEVLWDEAFNYNLDPLLENIVYEVRYSNVKEIDFDPLSDFGMINIFKKQLEH